MNNQNLSWYGVAKDEVAMLAFGLSSARGSASHSPDAVLSFRQPLAAGFPKSTSYATYQPPAMMVLSESETAETLSWLKVYTRDAFPLSQFSRVLTDKDWELFQAHAEPMSHSRPDRWACVVLGEILAQGESEAEPASLPLSRATASFSAAIARTDLVHGSPEINRTCTDRLRAIETERRFVRRPVSVSDLIPVWALIRADIDNHTDDAREIANLVLEAAVNFAGVNPHGHKIPATAFASPALHSDSVEERVVAFQRLAASLDDRVRVEPSFAPLASVAVAAAAFLVGRGTSHSFLLRKAPNLGPLSFVWFGLMSALMGPKGWDPQWSRSAKGIERQLRAGFSWDEPPTSDICWTEYAWLAKTFTGLQSFTELARSFPKTMTIEIVPGATCQLRIASNEVRGQSAQEAPPKMDPSVREVELKTLLDQFLALASRTKQILGGGSPLSSHQSELLLKEAVKSPPRPRRATKRAKD